MKRIGINVLYLLPDIVGGTETYARGLVGAISQCNPPYEFVLFINRELDNRLPEEFRAFERVVCPVQAVDRGKRYLFEQMRLPSLLRRHGISLVHSLGYTSPLRSHCPRVVTIHDLNFRAFGETMPLVRRAALSFFVRGAVCRSHRIITVSEFSRNEIVRTYRVDPQKVRVTPEAALIPHASSYPVNPRLIEGPYCVAFSSRSSNKNIQRLLDAYRLLRNRGSIHQRLVLIGHTPERKAELPSDVVSTGYVPRTTMFAILQAADFLIFPSYYEGFGLPVLEAMASGVPVVCSRAASLPEVGGDAAVYFDPFSVEDMASQIEQIASDTAMRSLLRQRGFENVKRFSWQKTAVQTLEVYNEVLGNE